MYLYLGQDTVINTEEIVGIFDLDNASTARWTRDFLNRAQREGEIVEVSPEIPKSFVLCGKRGEAAVYLSQISPTTLKKRVDFVKDASL